MPIRRFAVLAIAAAASSSAIAADMLPLDQGIYVPVGRACKGASNAEMVNYWGGKSSIGFAQAECTIGKMTRRGMVFTIHDVCKDIQSGDVIEGGPMVLKINRAKAFEMGGTHYRWCGTKPQW